MRGEERCKEIIEKIFDVFGCGKLLFWTLMKAINK